MIDKTNIVDIANIGIFQSKMAKFKELVWLKKSKIRFFIPKAKLVFAKLR